MARRNSRGRFVAGGLPPPGLPELTIDVRNIRRMSRIAGKVMYKRFLGHVHNELIVAADEALEYAKERASRNFDNPTSATGLSAQGLYHDTKPWVRGGIIGIGFGWTRRYGRVLEYGPSVTEWIIRPKWRKALRFMAVNWVGAGRSGGSYASGDAIVYSRSVLHKWKPAHKRPHLVPAVKHIQPIFQRRIAQAWMREWKRGIQAEVRYR
jgi:hypothetical protein